MINRIGNIKVLAALVLAMLAYSPVVRGADDAPTPAAPTGPEAIMISDVKISEALSQSAAAEGRTNQLHRVADDISTQFRSALGSTRKFKIVNGVGSDLSQIMKNMKGSALYNQDDPSVPKANKLRPPKYIVVPTIDDFQDVAEQLNSEGHNPLATARRIRISVVTTLYDSTTGEEKATADVEVKDRKTTRITPGMTSSGDDKDELLMTLTKRAAEQSAQRVVDVIFPARIISKVDKTVVINRGDGTTIAVGQVWDVFAPGAELKDPDTGAVLGHDEIPSGKVRITSVLPLFSKAEVVEDQGLDKGNLVRLHESKPATGGDQNNQGMDKKQ